MIALGYGSEKSCRPVETVYNQVSLREFKTILHCISWSLTIDVKNQVLQSF
jgi:hypothetical protein